MSALPLSELPIDPTAKELTVLKILRDMPADVVNAIIAEPGLVRSLPLFARHTQASVDLSIVLDLAEREKRTVHAQLTLEIGPNRPAKSRRMTDVSS